MSYLTSFFSYLAEFVLTQTNPSARYSFWWQLFNLLMYIPWSILPIAYILWVHERTYRSMKETIAALSVHKSNRATRMLDAEAICMFIVSSSIDDLDEDEEEEDKSTAGWRSEEIERKESLP